MAFTGVLTQLCRAVPGARGAVFVDHEGECIQQVSVDEALDPYELSVAGAHAAPLLATGLRPSRLTLRGDDGLTCIHVVTGAYALVLVCGPRTHAFQVTRPMDAALAAVKDLM